MGQLQHPLEGRRGGKAAADKVVGDVDGIVSAEAQLTLRLPGLQTALDGVIQVHLHQQVPDDGQNAA